MNAVSAGNRRGSVSWLSIRGYEAIQSSTFRPDAWTAAAMSASVMARLLT